MDATTKYAILQAGIGSTAESWLEAVKKANEGDPTWDDFVGNLEQGYEDADAVETFVRHMRDHEDWRMAIDDLAAMDADGLVEALAADDGEADGADAPEDENAFNAYLGYLSGAWDGQEDTWPGIAQWFRENAPDGTKGSVESFLQYVETSGDKATTLAEYGVALGEPGDEQAEEESVEDANPQWQDNPAYEPNADVGQISDETMQEMLAANPELANLSADEQRQLIEEVLEENQ